MEKIVHKQIQLKISDNIFNFELYPIGTQFNRISGIYTFFIIPVTENLRTVAEVLEPTTDQIPTTFYHLLYLGITNNFQKRLRQHHKIEQAKSLGMTHIGILKISSVRKRKNIERKLLKTYHPPLNQTWLQESLNINL